MPGFGILQGYKWEGGFGLPEYRFLSEEMSFGDTKLIRCTLRKFENDKVFEQNSRYIMILDGVLLNKKELLEEYDVTTVSELIVKMYSESETFFSRFRGPFHGALYDKKKKLWLVYTNQTGEKAVFYSCAGGELAVATELPLLYDIIRSNGKPLTVDENAAYMSLTFSRMEDDSTYAKEVKRLRGGTYLYKCGDVCEVREYHRFTKNPERFADCSEKEIIDEIEKYFSAAVKSQFDKDLEYGYKHLCDMSGGLDSRMDMWVAHDLGYKDFTLLTFGKADYLDEQISKKIALYWRDHHVITPTDNLCFMREIDKMIDMNGGTTLYSGITGGVRMLETIDMHSYGLEHSGLIGEVVLGSHIPGDSAIYSHMLESRLKDNSAFRESFGDNEIYLRYVVEFQGDANSVLLRNRYVEVCSPFLDVEFLQLCFDIPVGLRLDHGIYKDWIIAKHPEAARFKWKRLNGYITESETKLLCRKILYKGPHKAAKKLGIEKNTPLSMNPFDYWLEHDRDTRIFIINSFKQRYQAAGKYLSPQLRSDIVDLFKKGSAYERLMALNTVAALCRMLGLKTEAEV